MFWFIFLWNKFDFSSQIVQIDNGAKSGNKLIFTDKVPLNYTNFKQ